MLNWLLTLVLVSINIYLSTRINKKCFMNTYFKNLSDADEESIVEIIESAISLLDDVHCYDSEEFKELKAVRDALKYNADLNDTIEMYKNGE